MQATSRKMKYSVALLLAGSLAMGPALADKPDWAGQGNGKGKGAKHEQKDGARENRGEQKAERRDSDNRGDGRRSYFEDRHHVLVRDYYGEQYQGRRCPPGLAKKNNGCMPPGQAKKWQVGRTLPRDVIFYEVPQQLVLQIGPPPSGQRYVRVAGDILLIAIGTGMVIDAIQDLGRM